MTTSPILERIHSRAEQLRAKYNRGNGYGNTVASVGIGLLVGGLLFSRIAGRVPANVLVGGCLILVGVAMVAFAGAGSYTVVLVAADNHQPGIMGISEAGHGLQQLLDALHRVDTSHEEEYFLVFQI